jgi:hypothetical protein
MLGSMDAPDLMEAEMSVNPVFILAMWIRVDVVPLSVNAADESGTVSDTPMFLDLF